MTESSFPFAAVPVYQAQWSQMLAGVMGDGAVGAGDVVVTGDSTGMHVKVAAGSAWVRGFMYNNSAVATVNVAANASGNPRIDRVVLDLDPVAGSIHLAVVAGTPAGTPAAPALTQIAGGHWQMSLAQVLVANGAATITAGNVTSERVLAHSVNTVPVPVMTSVVDQITLRAGGVATPYLWTSGQVTAFSKNATGLAFGGLVTRTIRILFTGAVAAGVWSITGLSTDLLYNFGDFAYIGTIQTTGTVRSVIARVQTLGDIGATSSFMVSNSSGVYVPMDTATFPVANNDYLLLSASL